MMAVPALTPVTTPAALIVATEASELLQVPVVNVLVNVVVLEAQTNVAPVIVPAVVGMVSIFILCVADLLPQLLVMV